MCWRKKDRRGNQDTDVMNHLRDNPAAERKMTYEAENVSYKMQIHRQPSLLSAEKGDG